MNDHVDTGSSEGSPGAGALALPDDREIVQPADCVRRLPDPQGVLHVLGVEGSAAPLLARAVVEQRSSKVLYVAPSLDLAHRAHADLSFLLREADRRRPEHDHAPPRLSIPSEANPYADVHADRRATMSRAATLHALATGAPWSVLVTTPAGLARRVPPRGAMAVAGTRIAHEGELDLPDLLEHLADAGYLRVPVVEDPGSFAVRGGVIDVWPAGRETPVRVELYGDLVESLRDFDPETQRTGDPVEELAVPPAREALADDTHVDRARQVLRGLCDAVDLPSTKARQLVEDVATGTNYFGSEGFLPAFFDLEPLVAYLPDDAVVLVEDPASFVKAYRAELEGAYAGAAARAGAPHFPVAALYVEEDDLEKALKRRPAIAAHRTAVAGQDAARGVERLEAAPPDAPSLAIRDQADLRRSLDATRKSQGRRGALAPLVSAIGAWHDAGLDVTLTARGRTQAERLASLLEHRDVSVAIAPDEPKDPTTVRIVTGELTRGAVAPAGGFVLVTEEEIFGERARRKPARPRSTRAILEDLRALEPGDFVVHVEHGIGRYLGLEHKSIGDVTVDLLVVEYAGGDKLFLPVYRLNQVQKYSGGEGNPRIDRLGGQSFAKTKAKVKRRVRQMADQLLELYAERNAVEKEPLPPADDDYAEFEASFPFDETRDQAAAIEEVSRDLESPRVMDRLVCGDVGFGKTEVALRATFRAAMAGRQVALLCPTTVLAQQHYLTFSSRLDGYPMEVRTLSRFQSKKEQQETVRGLKEGGVDVVIGTHRLLSKDVHFKSLGLLVVDEEQRFGVTHKERIKQLRTAVDVLTLSATPIPRTLQLAVGGLRDMSLITTPPVDRRAIRTLTTRWDVTLLREAVERELGRGGQIFYVYNRVADIYERARKLQELVPRARIAVAHGQMAEATLEKTMIEFVDGVYDILVSTAIIESGLDIPRANTLIVDRADLFGLSQLYQLRGRVGRSKERAYCYLVVPPPSKLSDEARMRIEALGRHTDLGSGFHIATLDMELRGAGDLLGADQSGFVASVGFELFCQMLEEATHELRGETVTQAVDPELSFDVEALLPEDYVAEVGVRLSLYKRFASAVDETAVDELAAEMEDRFGEPPTEARRFVELMRVKTELRRLNVLGCEASSKRATLHLREDTPLDPVKVGKLVGARKLRWQLTPDMRLTRRPTDGESFDDGLALAAKMLDDLAEAGRDD